MKNKNKDLDGFYYEMQYCITDIIWAPFGKDYIGAITLVNKLKVLIKHSEIFEDLPSNPMILNPKAAPVPFPINPQPETTLIRCDGIIKSLKSLQNNSSLRNMDSEEVKNIILEMTNVNFAINHAYQAKITGKMQYGNYKPALELYEKEVKKGT